MLAIAFVSFLLAGSAATAQLDKSSACPAEAVAAEGDCLLSQRTAVARSAVTHSSVARIALSDHALRQRVLKYQVWHDKHALLQRSSNESKSKLESFIEKQKSSSEACSARLLESKRALDGIMKDLHAVEAQVESSEGLLKTETENLNITSDSIKAVHDTYDEEYDACVKQTEQAKKDLEMFEGELEELNQIAKPGVRYEEAVSVDIGEAPFQKNASESADSLLQKSAWDKAHCLAFIKFSQRRRQDPAANMSCDEQREELQTVFTETYIDVLKLKADAKSRVDDQTCYETASAKKTSELVPLTSSREQAAARIEFASQALATLQPVLEMLKTRIDLLEKHIEITLKPECKDIAEVSETLKEVRQLIMSLEKCPGRNDFTLTIPENPEEESGDEENVFMLQTGQSEGLEMP